jgi:signal transduction histidine kinase
MSPHNATVEPIASTGAEASALHGRWLILARTLWGALTLLALGLFVAAVPALYAQHNSPSEDVREGLARLGLSAGFYASYVTALLVVFALVCFTVAAVIARRKPEDGMAMFVSLFLVLLGTANAPNMQALEKMYPALASLTQCLLFLTFASLMLFLCLFPDGRFVPRWTRVLVPSWLGLLLVASISTGDSLAEPAGVWLALLILIGLPVGVVAQIYRYARVSAPLHRQQTKWVVFGIAVAISGQVVFPLLVDFFPSLAQPGSTALLYDLIDFTGVTLSYLFIPMSIGVAILRYRLWDIDVIINRTLVYGMLTACVVGFYVLVVGGLGTLLQARGNLLISLLATGLVAVLFAPLRNRLQRSVNHLMYGERDDPYAVLSRLGQRLEATLAPDAALRTIVETVAQALKLPYVAITLKQADEFVTAAEYGTSRGEPVVLPLAYQGEPVGQLILAPRSPEEALSASDKRLLEDLVRQAGTAVNAVLLTADLQRSRERLVTAREEERRRLRRDLHDGLGPQLAAQTLKVGSARSLYPRDPAAADALLSELEADMETALSDVRRLVYNLRPPALDELGLVGAIREAAAQYGRNGLNVSVDTPELLPALPAAVEVAAYRIVQEALTNVVRHARARNCGVRLLIDDELRLEISDDGVGLSVDRTAGVGLSSMRERAAELGGECSAEVSPTGGTRILARLSLPIIEPSERPAKGQA